MNYRPNYYFTEALRPFRDDGLPSRGWAIVNNQSMWIKTFKPEEKEEAEKFCNEHNVKEARREAMEV